jgi:hypothetical protein
MDSGKFLVEGEGRKANLVFKFMTPRPQCMWDSYKQRLVRSLATLCPKLW